MHNPAEAILNQADLGLKQFTQEAEVAQTTVQEVLWGLFPDVPPKIAKALGRITQDYGIDYEEIFAPADTLNDAYHLWQTEERRKVWGTITWDPADYVESEVSPFQELVLSTTPSGVRTFCTRYKLPRATAQRYMTGITRTMPTTIEKALMDVAYGYIPQLKGVQSGWL